MRFAPRDPAFISDPYPVYRELRDEHPARYDEPTDHWLVARYADVNTPGPTSAGASLGRLELQTSLPTLLARFPAWEPVEEPAWKPNYIIRGLEGLRVRT